MQGKVHQFIVRNTAPQEERQARGQVEIANPVRLSGRQIRGLGLNPEEKLGLGKNRAQRHFNAVIEIRTLSSGFINFYQAFHILRSGRLTECAAREVGNDLLRTLLFLACIRRPASENLLASGNVLGANRVVRAFDANAGNVREESETFDTTGLNGRAQGTLGSDR